MTELPTSGITKPDGLFTGDQLDLVFQSVSCGNTDGRFWLDSAERPGLGLLWDQGNKVFYLDSLESAGDQSELQKILTDVIYPSAMEVGLQYFNVHTLSDNLPSTAEAIFARWLKGNRTKHFYTSSPESIPQAEASGFGISYHAADQNLFDTSGLMDLNHVLAEIDWMWSSVDAYNRHGFGCVATSNNDVACWCTAEYVSNDRCGIGIETAEAYRGQGIATATAARFVEMCLDRNLHPYWECDTENKASARIAEKLGFADPVTSQCLTGWFA
jgi:RimJ/RimL family protein N-acetyltransferase